jgi:hypothetical protein
MVDRQIFDFGVRLLYEKLDTRFEGTRVRSDFELHLNYGVFWTELINT